jgi:hypothetical protein
MIDYLNQEMAFYLTNDLMTKAFAMQVQSEFTNAVSDLVPHINDLIESFGAVCSREAYPPMARQWVKFNEQTNPDDNTSSGPVFQMHKM